MTCVASSAVEGGYGTRTLAIPGGRQLTPRTTNPDKTGARRPVSNGI
jgi:hypothetical protein